MWVQKVPLFNIFFSLRWPIWSRSDSLENNLKKTLILPFEANGATFPKICTFIQILEHSWAFHWFVKKLDISYSPILEKVILGIEIIFSKNELVILDHDMSVKMCNVILAGNRKTKQTPHILFFSSQNPILPISISWDMAHPWS